MHEMKTFNAIAKEDVIKTKEQFWKEGSFPNPVEVIRKHCKAII